MVNQPVRKYFKIQLRAVQLSLNAGCKSSAVQLSGLPLAENDCPSYVISFESSDSMIRLEDQMHVEAASSEPRAVT